MFDASLTILQRAKKIMPGGVNSPVRSFYAVGGNPPFFCKGQGPYLYDIDSNQYIDYVASFGPMILGHSHPAIIKAVTSAVNNGLSFGAPTVLEVKLAEEINKYFPTIEMIRMVNSGTEATQSAIRLARGFTGKNKIIKFAGCYHGHNDALLVEAGSGALTYSVATSAGIPSEIIKHTLVAPYNDLKTTQKLFELYPNDIAAIIVEPIAGNMNLVLPESGFLSGLRSLCDQYNSLLIFDEIITGFRITLGGAQTLYNIQPDITCLGKIIGGGLPIGAFGGKREIFSYLAPLGAVYQAGTLSGNPIAMAAGIATIKELQKDGVYNKLEQNTKFFSEKLLSIAKKHGIPFATNHIGGLFGFRFMQDPENLQFKKFYHYMLKHGIYFAPSSFEVGFISTVHSQEILDKTLEICAQSFANL